MKRYKKVLLISVCLIIIVFIALAIFVIKNCFNTRKYDMDRALKYENAIISILSQQDEATLQDVFDFPFYQAYVIEDSYLAGEEFAQKYGLDISVEEMLPNESENIRRIVFVDEQGEFVYEFRYCFGQRLCADIQGKILHPNTIIQKIDNLIEDENAFSIEFLVDEKDKLVVDDEYCINNYYSKVLLNYKNIINDITNLNLEQIINKYPSPNAQLETQWEEMLKSIIKNSTDNNLSKYGFILKDISFDNTPELFWVDEDFNIFAIFSTLHPSKNLLGAYSIENHCTILIDDRLLVVENLENSNFECSVIHFENFEGLTKPSFKLGCEKGLYYKVEEDKKIDIDLTEFKEIYNNFINNEVADFRNNKIYFLSEHNK